MAHAQDIRIMMRQADEIVALGVQRNTWIKPNFDEYTVSQHISSYTGEPTPIVKMTRSKSASGICNNFTKSQIELLERNGWVLYTKDIARKVIPAITSV
jgi:hypothetical protein